MGVRNILDASTRSADPQLVSSEVDKLRCLACANKCLIAAGKRGICQLRFNRDGELRVPWGYVAGLAIDPIEKKPMYHVLPGKDALSFGMLGCNFHCAFCQNWFSSQVLQDTSAGATLQECSADRIVDLALEHNAPLVVSTYNEPLITADWSAEIFEKACAKGLKCGFVSNGYASEEVLKFLRPVMDLYKVDLKCFSEEKYHELGGRLKDVLATIERLKEMEFWVEVVTLVVPDFNDNEEELAGIAQFIAGVSVDIPWHVTAFHPNYKIRGPHPTKVSDLQRAYEAGKEAGLRYVYAGNLPGRVGSSENTYCHSCDALLIKRMGFTVIENRMSDGKCPDCNTEVPGVW